MDKPQIIARLGSGGMADVYLAMRRGIGGFVKLVVVKRLRTGTMDGDALAMFHDEARICARLNHPNVVQTHEAGFDGEHYRLEMEYLDGQPLHRIVSRAKTAGRAISSGMAVAVVQDVLSGLRYAHGLRDYDGTPLGIVHRDVSPQNIFVTYDGSVKLVDFGIAKAEGRVNVTQLGLVKGKVRYMAPEQAMGRALDARADIFAAGVVLWQLLVGRPYWGDAEELSVVRMLASGQMPPRARALAPTISEGLDAVCAQALAWNPEDRFADAGAFLDALTANAPEGSETSRGLGLLAAELFPDLRDAVRREIEKAALRPTAGDDEPDTRMIAMSSGAHPLVESVQLQVSERPVSRATQVGAAHPARSPRAVIAFVLVGISLAALWARPWRKPTTEPDAGSTTLGPSSEQASPPFQPRPALPVFVQPLAPEATVAVPGTTARTPAMTARTPAMTARTPAMTARPTPHGPSPSERSSATAAASTHEPPAPAGERPPPEDPPPKAPRPIDIDPWDSGAPP